MSIRVPLMYAAAVMVIDASLSEAGLLESASARSGVGSASSGECGVAPFGSPVSSGPNQSGGLNDVASVSEVNSTSATRRPASVPE